MPTKGRADITARTISREFTWIKRKMSAVSGGKRKTDRKYALNSV